LAAALLLLLLIFHVGAPFNPPVTHMMIDPLLLGSMHAEMPRNEELMYAMSGLAPMPVPSTSTVITTTQLWFSRHWITTVWDQRQLLASWRDNDMQVSGLEAPLPTPGCHYEHLHGLRPSRVLLPELIVGIHGASVAVHSWNRISETLFLTSTQAEEVQPCVAF
jgi:hypothetical protein